MLAIAPPRMSLNGDVVRDTIPGLRTSTAFFSSLSTNLRIDHTTPIPSPIPSPAILPISSASINADETLKSLSPLVVSGHPALDSGSDKKVSQTPKFLHGFDGGDDEDVPSFYLTDDPMERDQAFKVVLKSVADQQYFAIRSLLSHPLNLGVFALLLFLSSRITQCWLQGSAVQGKPALSGLPQSAGFLLAVVPSGSVLRVWFFLGVLALLSIYVTTYAYNTVASGLGNGSWLQPNDDIIVATSGSSGRVIGAVILGWTVSFRETGRGGARKRRISRAWIKAWAVDASSRNQDIGTSLLSEAVALVTRRCGADGCISFAKDHAHAQRVLPAFYNAPFDRRDQRASYILRFLVDEHRDKKRWG